MATVVEEVALRLLEQVRENYDAERGLTDDDLQSLYATFQKPLYGALHLVDAAAVQLLTSPSGRSVYKVAGSKGNAYVCLPSGVYCPCHFCKYSVLQRGEFLMCKHVLAARLAAAMGKCDASAVSDEAVTQLIATMATGST